METQHDLFPDTLTLVCETPDPVEDEDIPYSSEEEDYELDEEAIENLEIEIEKRYEQGAYWIRDEEAMAVATWES